jgi:hypothetical protein
LPLGRYVRGADYLAGPAQPQPPRQLWRASRTQTCTAFLLGAADNTCPVRRRRYFQTARVPPSSTLLRCRLVQRLRASHGSKNGPARQPPLQFRWPFYLLCHSEYRHFTGARSKYAEALWPRSREYVTEHPFVSPSLTWVQFLAILLPVGLAADFIAVTKAAPAGPNSAGILSIIAVLVGAMGVSILSFFEHYRSARPSDLIVIYLLVLVLLDILRTWLLFSSDSVFHLPLFFRLVSMGAVLVAEAMPKEHLFLSPSLGLAPEETAGVLQRIFFWWINGILTRGILDTDDLPPLPHDLSADKLRRSMLQAWGRRGTPIVLLCAICMPL